MQGVVAVVGLVLVWTGAINTLWDVAGNWDPAQVPPAGVAGLRFPTGVAQKVSRNNIDLSAAPPLTILIEDSGYDIAGNAVPTCGIDASYTSGSSIVGFDVIDHASCAEIELASVSGGTLNIAGDLPAKDLLKSGTGTVHFLIADNSARELRIAAGGAVVEGAFANTAVVLAGGTLAGSGTVASITGGSGVVSPGGNSIMAGLRIRTAAGDGVGTLNSGNVAFSAATTLTLELNGAFSADRLSVTGSVSLGGATLAASLGFAPSTTSSTAFTIVENDGADAVSGTFGGLAEGATFTLGGRSVRVSYVGGSGNDVTLTVLPLPVTLTLSPVSLAPMTAGTATSQTITTSDGTGPYAYAVSGGTLPAGLALSAAGALSGTPSTAGSYSFAVTATDSLANTGTRTYIGTIGSASAAITLAPSTLPAMRVGLAFSQTFTATGGTAPYAFAVSAGSLPAGLSLSADGALTGTPTTAGAYSFTVTVTDSGLVATAGVTTIVSTASLSYAGTVAPAAATLTIAPPTPPDLTAGTVVSVTITATGGTAPYTFAVTAGALPPGLSLAASGALTGTPTTAAAYSLTITGTDADGNSGSIVWAGTVAPAPVPAMPFWALLALGGILLGLSRTRVTAA